jgi:4-hydroxy-4-methyl-2-oxoglutarate aldolase
VIAGGGVRDTRDLRELGFPVWSAFVSPHGAGKHCARDVNVPVVRGESTIDVLGLPKEE